jgi:nucleoside-diphosphate-sugar epimerase
MAAAFIYVFSLLYFSHGLLAVFLGPVALLGLNGVLGIYSRHKVASGNKKALLLSLSTWGSAGVVWLAGGGPAALLWVALVWAPLILPRYVLNLDPKHQRNAIASAIINRGPVLVVGGAGYIGTHLVDLLLREGYRVRILDRLLYGRKPTEDLLANERCELIEGDATDIVKLVAAMDRASAVVHLAGLVGDPACAIDADFSRHMNVIATRMVKEVALSLGVPRFVFASSCSVYGVSDVEVGETSKLNPVSLYAHNKADSEQELLVTPDEYFYATVLRFATVFGHSRRPRFDLVANLFTAQAFLDGRITVHGGNQWRPFIHVRDLARAVLAVLDADPRVVRGQIFNVGDSRLNMTIGQLAERIQKVVSHARPVELDIDEGTQDPRNYAVSFAKIQRVLGFRAETLLEEGISEMVAEFQKGTYGHYTDPIYSNLYMTQRMLDELQEPLQATRLYHPLSESYSIRSA